MNDSAHDRLAKLFALGETQRTGPGEPQPGELFRGTGWFVSEDEAGLQLHYISGDIAGREKSLVITREEADTLRDSGRLNDLLIAHGAG